MTFNKLEMDKLVNRVIRRKTEIFDILSKYGFIKEEPITKKEKKFQKTLNNLEIQIIYLILMISLKKN